MIKNLLFFCLISIIFFSCTVVRTAEVIKLNFGAGAAQEPGGDYIKLNDGSKINGKITTYRVPTGGGIFKKGKHNVIMDGKEYNLKEVVQFQKDSACFARPKGYSFFVERKVFGKINVYYRHIDEYVSDSKGRSYHDVYDLHFLQKGDEAKIEKYSVGLLAKMVADNSTALELVEDYKSAKKRKKSDSDLEAAIKLYNKK
jgi:hypothetical protein